MSTALTDHDFIRNVPGAGATAASRTTLEPEALAKKILEETPSTEEAFASFEEMVSFIGEAMAAGFVGGSGPTAPTVAMSGINKD